MSDLKSAILVIILIMLVVSPVDAAIKACTACNSTCNTLPGAPNMTAGPPGADGAANMTMNLTPNMTAGVNGINNMTMNLTPNMTAGANGLNNMTMNMTPNMTANMTMNQTPGPNNDAWYAWINGTRSFTGKINLGGFNISNVLDPVAAQDATTRGWVLSQINSSPSVGGGDTTQFAFLNGTRSFTRVNLTGSGANITGIMAVIGNSDAVNKSYMISQINSSPSAPGGGWDGTGALFINGTRAMTGTLNVSTNISGIKTIIGPDDAVNKSYVDSGTTANLTIVAASEFFDPSTQAIPGFLGAAISSGTVGAVATTGAHPGVIYMRDSTTANGGYRFGCAGTQRIAGGEYYEVVFQPVGVRVGQTAKMGWSDSTAAGTLPVDGVFFNISATGAAITLRGNTSSNSVRSGTLTSYAPTTATWYRGTISVNPAANLVTYTLYSESGASLWTDTVATNIPTGAGRDTSPCIIVAQDTTDAAADILRLDYAKWAVNRSLAR